MTLILKQSTSIDIRVGPFVDATDAVTPEIGITLAGADQAEVLKFNGAATVTMAGAFVAITGCDGWYDYTVAVGDVDTVGEVVFVVQDSSVCLPVFVRGQVVEEAVYDSMYLAASASLATEAKQDLIQADLDLITGTDGATLATAQALYAPSKAGDAMTLTAAAVDLVWDEDATAHQTQGTFGQAIGDPGVVAKSLWEATVSDAAGVSVAADVIAVKAETVLIVADTNELQADWVDTGRLDNILDARMAEASINTTGGAVDLVTTTTTATTATNLTNAPTNGDLTATMKTSVTTSADNALNVTTYAEPIQGLPTETTTLVDKIGYLYKVLRNKKTATATEIQIFNDAGTIVDHKRTISDDATTYTEGKIATGP